MNISAKRIFYLLFFSVLLASCSTPLTELIYLNGIETGKTYETGPQPEAYRIRPNDQLFVQVISDDPTNVAIFNLTNTQLGSVSAGSSTSSMELITYLVNEEGKIAFPQLGDLQVGGLTVEEVTVVIQKGVNRYLEGASIFVKLVNRSITVMGEVIQPGQKLMVKNQLTIFEALGAAGGLNDWGNRKNIKLVRETPAGKLVGEINLLDPGVINSPYYYIVPHDVIVVEPDKKVYGAKTLPWAAPLGVATSLVSIALSIITLFAL